MIEKKWFIVALIFQLVPGPTNKKKLKELEIKYTLRENNLII